MESNNMQIAYGGNENSDWLVLVLRASACQHQGHRGDKVGMHIDYQVILLLLDTLSPIE
jgi:hypothetical protein